MTQLGKLWAGNLYGTNTGKLFVSIEVIKNKVTGKLRLNDDLYGIAVYSLKGNFDGLKLTMSGSPEEGREGTELSNINVDCVVTPEGKLKGEWESEVGTAGTFVLFPHSGSDTQKEVSTPKAPEQLYVSSKPLGSISISFEEIEKLIKNVTENFDHKNPIITYKADGIERSQYWEDFVLRRDEIGELKYFKLFIQEQEENGINKQILIELNSDGENLLRVQSSKEMWVLGKVKKLSSLLKKHERIFSTIFKKWGLAINQIIILIMLILIPEFRSINDRAIFVFALTGISIIYFLIQFKLIPNAKIYISSAPPNFFTRSWQGVLYLAYPIIASLIAAYLYAYLT